MSIEMESLSNGKAVVLMLCLAVVGWSEAESDLPDIELIKELPSDIPTCKRNDPELNACVKSAFQTTLLYLKNGSKELNIPPLDPFVLERSQTYQYSNGVLQGRAALTDLRVYGLSEAIIDHVNLEFEDNKIHMEIESHLSKLTAEGFYKADVKLNELKMMPKGYFNVSMSDMTVRATHEGELYERDGHTFLRLSKIRTEPEIGDVKFYATGMLPDPTLNNALIEFINQNWRFIYTSILPETRKTLEPLMLKVANDFFAKLPFDFLLTED